MSLLEDLATEIPRALAVCANPGCDAILTELGEQYCSQRCEDAHDEWSREVEALEADYERDHEPHWTELEAS